MEGAFLVNEKGKVMDILSSIDKENQNIQVVANTGKINQQWDIVYADEYPAEPTKGQLNKDFGLYVERDFYVVSELANNKYLEVVNNRNIVIKTPNGRNTQKWYFHQ